MAPRLHSLCLAAALDLDQDTGRGSRALDRAQIGGQRPGIGAAEAKHRHVGMAADQPRAQAMSEAVEIDAAAE
jgi:hypothetical protein